MLRVLGRASARRSRGLVVVGLLVLSACGSSDQDGEVAGPTTTAAATSSSGGATQTTAGASGTTRVTSPAGSVEGALKRRDVPPEGVKAQFEHFQEGDGSCFELDESKPAAVVDFPRTEIASTFVICFPGFADDKPVQADVRLPDGKVRKISATFYNSFGVPNASWTAVPGDPLGRYDVSATQGTLKGTGSFTVTAASLPSMVEIEPAQGPPGTTFRFGIAGFEANSTVDLYLYKVDGGTHSYLTKVAAAMDGQGQTVFSFPTAKDDPKGGYCFLRRGPKAALDYVCSLSFALT